VDRVTPSPTSVAVKALQPADGSILARAMRRRSTPRKFEVKSSSTNITAVRLEQLNDPTCAGWSWRSIYGTLALTEFKLDVGPADVPQNGGDQIASATADVSPAEKDLESILTTKRIAPGNRADWVRDRPQTIRLWSVDIGPGRSNVPRQAVFVLDKQSALTAGRYSSSS